MGSGRWPPRAAVVLLLTALANTGCSDAPAPAAVPPTSASRTATTPNRCDGPEISGLAPIEVGAVGDKATLFGLVMATASPIVAGAEVKIVWRMTGKGPVTFTAFDPQGGATPLAWGPDFHGGQGASSYHRPGSEWASATSSLRLAVGAFMPSEQSARPMCGSWSIRSDQRSNQSEARVAVRLEAVQTWATSTSRNQPSYRGRS